MVFFILRVIFSLCYIPSNICTTPLFSSFIGSLFLHLTTNEWPQNQWNDVPHMVKPHKHDGHLIIHWILAPVAFWHLLMSALLKKQHVVTSELIKSHKLDVIVLSESWLKLNKKFSLSAEITSARVYTSYFTLPWFNGSGHGVDIITRKGIKSSIFSH